MILLNWEGRKRVFSSCSELEEKLKITRLDEEEKLLLKRKSAKGELVYGCINPYCMEIKNEHSGIFCDSKEGLDKLLYILLEEI
jgi:hypothetical protein